MPEKIFEIRIVNIYNMSEMVRSNIIKEVAQKSDSFRSNFQGFAKVTYVTASPPRISKIEPIEGTIVEQFEAIEEDFSVF